MTTQTDVLAVLAAPYGWRNGGAWRTGEIAHRLGLPVARALPALRRAAKTGNVECLGTAEQVWPGEWLGNNVLRYGEFVWRLTDAYAIAHGNEPCRLEAAQRAALANMGGQS